MNVSNPKLFERGFSICELMGFVLCDLPWLVSTLSIFRSTPSRFVFFSHFLAPIFLPLLNLQRFPLSLSLCLSFQTKINMLEDKSRNKIKLRFREIWTAFSRIADIVSIMILRRGYASDCLIPLRMARLAMTLTLSSSMQEIFQSIFLHDDFRTTNRTPTIKLIHRESIFSVDCLTVSPVTWKISQK